MITAAVPVLSRHRGFSMPRILIVDDQPVICAGLRTLLKQIWLSGVVAEVSQVAAALQHVQANKIDLVILEISLPGRDGFQLLEDIQRLNLHVTALVYTRHSAEEYGIRALKSGARGFVSKTDPIQELMVAIRKVSAGGKYISPILAALMADRLESPSRKSPRESLSNREDQVMRKIAAGYSLKAIAEDLCVSPKTVSTYRARVLAKMRMKCNADIVRYIVENSSRMTPENGNGVQVGSRPTPDITPPARDPRRRSTTPLPS